MKKKLFLTAAMMCLAVLFSGCQSNPTEAPETADPVAATESHIWVEKTQTVHHDETGHYEETGHYDQVKTEKKSYITCNKCGYSEDAAGGISDTMVRHVTDECDSTYSIAYQDVYETQWVSDGQHWVIDTLAYDETVSDGYQCSVCGATK
jgi:hypothetical protein